MTTNATPAFLIDTNVLIYAYDGAPVPKRSRAIEVLRRLRASGLGTFSVQVLGEFLTNVTRKPIIPLTPDQARDTSVRLGRSWPVLDLTVRTFMDAVEGVRLHSMSYWDALIWATAKQNGLLYVLTENRQSSHLIGGIRFVNPFDPSFDLTLLD